jgi:hypothetical protein
MAGAQIPVGMLLEGTDDADRGQVIEDVVVERFFEAVGVEADRASAVAYGRFLGPDSPGDGQ